MAVSLKPERLKRYKDVAMLLIKYGRSDLVNHAAFEGVELEELSGPTATATGEELADDLEKLGPTDRKSVV